MGTQYRSGIYYHSEEQKHAAEKMIQTLNESKVFDSSIVTEVRAFTVFYPAEETHQDYYNQNTNQPYCAAVISPKVKKLIRKHESRLN